MCFRQIIAFATGLILAIFAVIGIAILLTASDEPSPSQDSAAPTTAASPDNDSGNDGPGDSGESGDSLSTAPTEPGTIKSCPAVVIETNAVSSTQTVSLKRVSLISCRTVGDLIKGAFGYGPLEPLRSEETGYGTHTRTFTGGWSCEDGAAASCWNTNENYNVIRNPYIDRMLAISAPITHG